MTGPINRRPLRSRGTLWAARLAKSATRHGFTPNGISQASVGFAALGALFFVLSVHASGLLQSLCLLAAAATIQARLLCNLLDGMVAIEGGKATRDGPFWNEAPDRAADIFFLAGAGFAAGNPTFGVFAGALAIATAYLRELGRAEGLPPDFSGPMAKPHRMAALSIGSLIAAIAAPAFTMTLTLWIIAAGTVLTILFRARRLIAALKAK